MAMKDLGLPMWQLEVKNPPANEETQVGKMPWRRNWQPPPLLLPGKFYGQRSFDGLQSMGPHRVRPD